MNIQLTLQAITREDVLGHFLQRLETTRRLGESQMKVMGMELRVHQVQSIEKQRNEQEALLFVEQTKQLRRCLQG